MVENETVTWFRGSSLSVPRRDFAPAELRLPFELPVLTVADDGSLCAYRKPDGLAAIPERLVKTGSVPAIQVVDGDLRTWRPTKLLAVSASDKKLFGQRIFFAEFQYVEGLSSDLETLRVALRTAIDRDADDLWNQITPHDVLISHATRATSFSELVDIIIDLGGQGA